MTRRRRYETVAISAPLNSVWQKPGESAARWRVTFYDVLDESYRLTGPDGQVEVVKRLKLLTDWAPVFSEAVH